MTSQQNDENTRVIHNHWCELYVLNQHLLTEEARARGSLYPGFNRTHTQEGYENYFWLDGSCDKTLWIIMSEFLSKKDELTLPKIKSPGSTMFFTYGEGWCSDDLFDTIYALIDLFGITGKISYQCCSVNAQDMYENYRLKNNKPESIIQCIYKNHGFLEEGNRDYYRLPMPKCRVNVLPYEQKKLFTSLNWNNWDHRQALLGLMHYHDLIEDGNITSPCVNKYSYDTQADYKLLQYSVDTFFANDVEHDAILEKLPSILKNYPLVVDDRSHYTTTEEGLTISANIGPVYQARINGLIEVIPETIYSGAHFFSEKTFWAMLVEKPYIMVCGAGALKSLRKIGFKTFDPYIDESYDDEEDGVLRLKKIVLELKRLKELRINKPHEFNLMYQCMIALAKHNRKVFHDYMVGNNL